LPPSFLEAARIAQEFDELGDFLLGLVATGDVGEGRLGLFLVEQLRARTAEAHRTLAAALLHLAHEIHPDADEQQPGQHVDQASCPATGRWTAASARW
jgi:hypothetical protein